MNNSRNCCWRRTTSTSCTCMPEFQTVKLPFQQTHLFNGDNILQLANIWPDEERGWKFAAARVTSQVAQLNIVILQAKRSLVSFSLLKITSSIESWPESVNYEAAANCRLEATEDLQCLTIMEEVNPRLSLNERNSWRMCATMSDRIFSKTTKHKRKRMKWKKEEKRKKKSVMQKLTG